MNELMTTSILSMGTMAVLFAGILAFADKKLKVEEDPMVARINGLLPGVNCGACGFLSCRDFAEHIVLQGADPGKCRVVNGEAREELLKITGGGEAITPGLPLVLCAAEEDNKLPTADYRGIRTCRGANIVFGGGMKCEYGCMGFGDCCGVCPFDALHMVKGLPRVDEDKCTGCGKCAAECPRKIINMGEKKYKSIFYVACASRDAALRVREICGVGCIACGICEKLSPEKFFVIENNLAKADLSKQSDQDKTEMIAGKCPTKVIKKV